MGTVPPFFRQSSRLYQYQQVRCQVALVGTGTRIRQNWNLVRILRLELSSFSIWLNAKKKRPKANITGSARTP